MTSILSLRTLCAAAFFTIAGVSFNAASACDNYSCHYETIVTLKVVTEPVIIYVTKYTDCGRPYRVKVVSHKKVTIPVVRKVLVCN